MSKLWEEYELTRSQASEIAKPLEDTAGASRRLAELRSEIKALGSVNLSAIEEYLEVSERYEFLSAQVSDAENAKERLQELIAELSGEMKRIFKRNFELISQSFSQVFTELFGGGTAKLYLSNNDDVLGSGIEISAQPPGKSVKSLSLLSGGEQSFIAIAIFFAILKVNPSPFCLFDEIEAALDDPNVERFAEYLQKMCDSTQFIAITHRQGTMEHADRLYGVTMQEKGVSKLLELNMPQAESFGLDGKGK